MTRKVRFSDRLNEAMRIRGIKAVDLHRKTGLSESTISQYRSGYAQPRDENLITISEVLQVNPLWLKGLTDDPTYNAWNMPINSEPIKLTDDEEDLIYKLRLIPAADADFVTRFVNAKYNDMYQ